MPGAPAGKVVGQLKLKVLPDTSKFAADLKKFAERMERQIRIELPVSVDGTEAVAELRALKARLETIAKVNEVDIPVDVDGSRATRSMVGVLAQLKAMSAAMPSITSGGGQITQMLGRWGAILGIVGVLILALGPSLAILIPMVGGLVFGGLAVFAAWDKVSKLFATLAPQWKALKAAVGTEMVKGLQPLISAIGTKLFPVLQKGLVTMAGFLNGAFKSLAKWLTSADGLERIGKAFDAIGIATSPLFSLLTPLSKIFVELSIAAAPALKEMGVALLSLTDRFAAFLQSGKATDTITQSLRDVGNIFKIIGRVSATVFPAIFAAVQAAIPFFEGLGLVVQVLAIFFKPLFELMAAHTTTMKVIGVLVGALAVAFLLLTSPIFAIVVAIAAIVAIGALLVKGWNFLRSWAPKVWAAMSAATSVAWQAIKKAVVAGVTWVGNKIKSGWNAVKTFTKTAWNLFTTLLQVAWTTAKRTVSTGIANILAFIRALPGKIMGFLSRLPGDLLGIGADMASGLLRGIQNGWNAVTSWVQSAIAKIPLAIRKLLGIASPSRVFAAIGSYTVQGFVVGLKSQQKSLNRAVANVFDISTAPSLANTSFNPSLTAGISSQMSAQVGAIVDNTTTSAQEIFINWETGRGVMKRIAQTTLAAKEFQSRQDAVLAGAPV